MGNTSARWEVRQESRSAYRVHTAFVKRYGASPRGGLACGVWVSHLIIENRVFITLHPRHTKVSLIINHEKNRFSLAKQSANPIYHWLGSHTLHCLIPSSTPANQSTFVELPCLECKRPATHDMQGISALWRINILLGYLCGSI